MRILSYVGLMFLCNLAIGQLDTNLAVFEDMAEVELNEIKSFDRWEQNTVYFPSGRKRDEIRTYVSSGCKTDEKCVIKYQHQVYFDDSLSTLAMKEGKYLVLNSKKATFRHYGWWYAADAKVYRRVKEKTTRQLDS